MRTSVNDSWHIPSGSIRGPVLSTACSWVILASLVCATDAHAAGPCTAPAFCEAAHLLQDATNFARPMAADGDVIAVQWPTTDCTSGLPACQGVRVYRNVGGWTLEAVLTGSLDTGQGAFGKTLDVDGDVIVVGAATDNGDLLANGIVYVFRFNGVDWIEEATLTPPPLHSAVSFAGAVAVDGDHVVVGAPHSPCIPNTGNTCGAAFAFHHSAGTWTGQVLEHNQSQTFGKFVDVDQDRAIVARPGQDQAQEFVFDGASWSSAFFIQRAEHVNAVSLDGDLLAVSTEPPAGSETQAVISLHRRTPGGWVEEAELIPSNIAVWFQLYTLVLEGDTLLFASQRTGISVFRENGGSWTEAGVIRLPTADFQKTVGLAGTIVAFTSWDYPCNEENCNFLSTIDLAAGSADCDCNDVSNACELLYQTQPDCNDNVLPDNCDILAGAIDCNGSLVPDECELGINDCNYNAVPDECDVPSNFSLDCDGDAVPDECEIDCQPNGIPDSCDIAEGDSLDLDEDGVPDECASLTLLAESPAIKKNRFLSFAVDPESAGQLTALRVRLLSLYHPEHSTWEPRPDFTQFESEYRYVTLFRDAANAPVFDCADPVTGTFKCANLSCTPEYRDWAAELGGTVLHVTGDSILPSSSYSVELLGPACQGQELTCGVRSSALAIATVNRWGDIYGNPSGIPDGNTNAIDLGSMIDTIKVVGNPRTEPRGLLFGASTNPATRSVNVQDVGMVVEALKGLSYRHSLASCP